MLRRTIGSHSRVVRGFQINKVAAQVSATDFIFAKQEASLLYSFFSFPGLDAAAASHRLLTLFSEPDRVIHSVFGRKDSAIDFVADIDSPFYEDAVALGHIESNVKPFTGESLLIDAVTSLKEYVDKTLLISNVPEILVLDGGSCKKISYHLHVRIPGRVFSDFRAVRDVANAVNASVPGRPMDISIYRNNGMLRMAYTPKYSDKCRVLRPLVANDSELKQLVLSPTVLTREEVMARSLILRPDATDAKIIHPCGKGRRLVHDDHGNLIPAYLAEDKKWLRFSEATAAVRNLPNEFADDYDTWVRIGLAIHSFGTEPEILAHWVTFSARCRFKFTMSDCEKKWIIFAGRPDCHNWRRGYTYLTRCLKGVCISRRLKHRK